MHRVRWDIEEAVAIVALYYEYKNNSSESFDLSAKLHQLSDILNKRADILEIPHDDKFRNYTGVKMIFFNVMYVDTNGEEGLSSASQLIYKTVDMYKNDYNTFVKVLNAFNDKYLIK